MSLAKSYRRRRVSTSEVLGVAAKNSLDLAGEGMEDQREKTVWKVGQTEADHEQIY